METIYITDSTRIERPTIATLGFFDGVHHGHRYLLKQLKEWGRTTRLQTAVATFQEHPRTVLQSNYLPKLLSSLEERLELLQTTEIDYVYLLHFTPELADTTALNFMRKILYQQLRIQELLIGYDHKFGKDQLEGYAIYARQGQTFGMKVRQAMECSAIDQAHISSTIIRKLIREGNVEKAAEFLSYCYFLEGLVVHGNHLGRTIGFPTANLEINSQEKLVPMEGVYGALVFVDGKTYSGMAYIGKRPTILSGGEQRVEVNIFNFDEDIYGKKIRIEFKRFIRPDIQFNGLEALKQQLAIDKAIIAGG